MTFPPTGSEEAQHLISHFKKKGLLAIVGAGFDPGVSNIFSAYARDYLFDQIDTIDILDCNGGSKDESIKF